LSASISTLRDNFTDGIESDAWAASGISGGATKGESSGDAVFTLPTSAGVGPHVAYYRTPVTYDLTASNWYINIDTMVATGVAATAFFDLYMDGNNILRWRQLSNAITARSTVNGVETQQYTATWSATTYKYLRITESGGNILWQSSTNGTSWTTRATVAVSSLFPVTDLYVQFGASCGNVASPGAFRVEDVNLTLPALSTAWNWTEAIWPLTNRHRTITMAIDTANTGAGYVLTADGVDASDAPSGNLRYWSGPMHDGRQLTLCATQAQAQAMAVNIPLDGRVDLPDMIEARCFKVFHRSIDGAAYTIRELFPRRLLQGDDVETETLTALHIRAGTITADKISAIFTITGRRIQTGTSLARVVMSGETFGGLITYNDTDTYDPTTGTGTYQILLSLADGKLSAGAGNTILDDDGLTCTMSAAFLSKSAVKFNTSGGVLAGSVYALGVGGGQSLHVRVDAGTSINSTAIMEAFAPTGKQGLAQLFAQSAGSQATLSVKADDSASPDTRMDFSGETFLAGGLNLGSATGAAAGALKASSSIQATSALLTGGLTVGGASFVANAGQIIQTLQDSARVFNSAAISVANNTPQALTFNSETWDGNALHSTVTNTSRLTAVTAGKYIIVGMVEWTANATGRRQISLSVNNTTTIASTIINTASGTVVERQIVTAIYDMAATDYVELIAFQNSGGALNVTRTAAISPELMMHRLV
jgi:hypothetical protein